MTGLGLNPSSPEDEQLLTAIRVAADSFAESVIAAECAAPSVSPPHLGTAAATAADSSAKPQNIASPKSLAVAEMRGFSDTLTRADPTLQSDQLASSDTVAKSIFIPKSDVGTDPGDQKSDGIVAVPDSAEPKSWRDPESIRARSSAQDTSVMDYLGSSGGGVLIAASTLSSSSLNLAADLNDAIVSPVTDRIILGNGSGAANSIGGEGVIPAGFWSGVAGQFGLSLSLASAATTNSDEGRRESSHVEAGGFDPDAGASSNQKGDAASGGGGCAGPNSKINDNVNSGATSLNLSKSLPAPRAARAAGTESNRRIREWGAYTIGYSGDDRRSVMDAAAVAAAAAASAGETAARTRRFTNRRRPPYGDLVGISGRRGMRGLVGLFGQVGGRVLLGECCRRTMGDDIHHLFR